MTSTNHMKALLEAGQSFWLDTISRDMIASGDLKRMIKLYGLRGVTSNPDIFQKAITGSTSYDAQIARLAKAGKSTLEIYEALVVEDIRKAADVLRPVYRDSKGVDGFVSLEVSPHLAYDTNGTIAEARRLWAAVGRPNVMVKVPATVAGIPAITQLVADGINVNVTLIFSLENHDDVMEAYIEGLELRQSRGEPVDTVASVASFFVSRIDTLVDSLLATRVGGMACESGTGPQSLMGRTAIACAKVAYQNFLAVFRGDRFARLARAGARVQRPLWASTSTKNPLYPPWMYVAPLIGPDTVNTMPPETVAAWLAHEEIPATPSIGQGLEEARFVLESLKHYDIDLVSVTKSLQEEGVAKFNRPFDRLLASTAAKRVAAAGADPGQSESPGAGAASVKTIATGLEDAQIIKRLWMKDPTIWTSEGPGGSVYKAIANRLGWLDVAPKMLEQAAEVTAFARGVRKSGFKHVVLLGMGGSSLCPEVCATTFGPQKGWPELIVLDSTSPDAVAAVEKRIDLRRSLFVPASKSGSTIETNSFFQYFYARLAAEGVGNPGDHFITITDPGSPFIRVAEEHGFRRIFLNPADIGGRYSALSLFGLVPMALMGIDIARLLGRAVEFSRDAGSVPGVAANPAVALGAMLGALARQGRDKVTFIASPGVAAFGYWVEQLIAESTGKEGVGILPVEGERLRKPDAYGGDRVFVGLQLAGDKAVEPSLRSLEKAGFPVVRIALRDAHDLGREFLRWEIATAVAGAVMRINPFDEPNVSESKKNTGDILAEGRSRGSLPVPKAHMEESGLRLTFSAAARKGVSASRPAAALKELMKGSEPGDYVALLGFLPPSPAVGSGMAAVREAAGVLSECATTSGIGPRYLHSTGQLHKGGANNGIFVMFMSDAGTSIDVPGAEFDFGTLFHAQALGDFRSLDTHGRRAVLVHLGSDVPKGLARVAAWLGARKAR